MAEVFIISDTHFGHKNIIKFKRDDGTPLRDFKSITEMHIMMIDAWNSVVTDKDKVYHLGDVAFSEDGLKIMRMLRGKKRLVMGNHDFYSARKYLEFFDRLYGVRQINGIWMTHVPMAVCSLSRAKINVHGHLHDGKVMVMDGHQELNGEYTQTEVEDKRYFNACVENLNYVPISIDELPIPEKRDD